MVGPTRYLLYDFTGAFCELVKVQSNDFSLLSMRPPPQFPYQRGLTTLYLPAVNAAC